MLRPAAASAPGKVILMGEHAAVYHRPALVAALDLRLRARIEPRQGDVEILLPQLGTERRLPWTEILAYARRRRDAWQRYAEAPSPATFAEVHGDDATHLVQIALGEAADALGLAEPGGMRLEITSEIPQGSGFGSSAAAAAAILLAFLTAADAETADLDRPGLEAAGLKTVGLETLALEVERRQHGNPSGVDTAAVLHGGLLRARRRAPGEAGTGLELQTVEPVPGVLEGFRLYHSGTPAEDTGTVVEAVRRRRAADPVAFEALLDRMALATETLLAAVSGTGPVAAVCAAVRDCQRCLEALGVVPAPVRDLVRRVEAAGGAAKISGAGALSGSGAGSLLVYHPQPACIEGWSFLAPLPSFSAALGAAGAHREPLP